MMTFKALTTPAALLVTMTLLSAPAWAGQRGHRVVGRVENDDPPGHRIGAG